MKKTIKLLLTLAAMALLGTLLTFSAFAAVLTGKCGDNLTYKIDNETCVLEISGTGEMTNYSPYPGAPWYSYTSYVKTVKISDGVTSIGKYAFYDCSSLGSIVIPDSVTSIGSSAFYNCSSLTSVTIPNSVTSIGEGAFDNCRSLGSIVIPDSVTSIGSYAFEYCSSLKDLYISDLESWLNVKLSGSSSHPLYSAGGNLYIDGVLATDIEIPDTVSNIGNYAFLHCDSITSVILPDSVTSIGNYAFSNCSWLASVIIGDSVTSIADYAFRGCSGLQSIVIPDSVTSIGDSAFRECSSLQSIVIPDSVTSIGSYAFRFCSSLTSIVIPDSVTSIGSYAFAGCSSLQSIVIPDSVTSIGNQAFFYCSSLASVIIGDSVTSIGSEAFYYCSSLASVVIGDSVTSIGNWAFSNCSSLTSVTFKAKNATISSNAFNSCSNLETIYCYKNSTADEYFSDENYTKIYLDDINVGSIEIGSATAFCGDTVSIDITLSDCQGISGLLMKLDFDRDALTLKEIIYKNAEANHEDNLNEESGEDHISIVLYNEADVLTNGVLLTLVFEVAENAVVGDHIIDLYYVEATNQDKVKMDITETDGKITVCKINYGDVNSDGEINIKDIVLLAQYLADWSVTIDPITADCDADGKISIIDIVLLAQFLAGWGVTLG